MELLFAILLLCWYTQKFPKYQRLKVHKSKTANPKISQYSVRSIILNYSQICNVLYSFKRLWGLAEVQNVVISIWSLQVLWPLQYDENWAFSDIENFPIFIFRETKDILFLQSMCFQFINAMLSQTDDFEFRMHLRNEIVRNGLYDYLGKFHLFCFTSSSMIIY